MGNILTRTKTAMILMSIAMFVFGICLLVEPVGSVLAFTTFLAWLLTITGVATLISAIVQRKTPQAKVDIWVSIITLIPGLCLLFFPVVSDIYIFFLIGFWVLFTGIQDLFEAYNANKAGNKNTGLMIANGVLSIILGILVLVTPGITAWSFVIVAGVSLILDAIGDFVVALKL